MYTGASCIYKISLTIEFNMSRTQVSKDLYKGLKRSQAQK